MQEEQVRKFIEDYISGNSSEDEHLQFIELLKNEPNERLKNLADQYLQAMKNKTSLTNTNLATKIEAGLDQLDLRYESRTEAKLRRFISFRNVAAAAILLLAIVNIWIYKNKQEPINPVAGSKKEIKQDVRPGSNKAILTLSNGTSITLDSIANGTITQQSNAEIVKQNGQLSYNSLNQNPEKDSYNTIAIPAGGQYQLTLSDGTKVWLNASSSLRYPVTFFGKERKVELTGEGYFEVAKNASMPFSVNIAGKGEVRVLGTHFNINAYADESTINTTLFEGKVKIRTINNDGSQIENAKELNPGEQAQLNKNGYIRLNKNVDIDAVLAWKNGYFSFAESDIHTIMRQLSRWYDMTVVYEGQISDRRFGGEIARSSNLSEVLRVLEESKIHFRIEGRKIMVLP